MSDLADRLVEVDARIADSARAAGREPSEITRIVVTKLHPLHTIAELYRLGVRDFGENRQQELSEKVAQQHSMTDACWHFVGQVQTKKARAVRRDADVVHSVDRLRLVQALAAEETLKVLIQVNLTPDPGRGGAAPEDVSALAEDILNIPSLQLCGVMAVAPLDEHPAAAFERVRRSADQVRALQASATWMSIGMSADFAEAISAGATHLRIGTAITGPRPVHG